MNYPRDWHEISNSIKEIAGWRCQNCNHGHDPHSGHTLTVHHIDKNPANCHPSNLVALCQTCHLHFQHNSNLFQLSFWGQTKWHQAFLDRLQPKSIPTIKYHPAL